MQFPASATRHVVKYVSIVTEPVADDDSLRASSDVLFEPTNLQRLVSADALQKVPVYWCDDSSETAEEVPTELSFLPGFPCNGSQNSISDTLPPNIAVYEPDAALDQEEPALRSDAGTLQASPPAAAPATAPPALERQSDWPNYVAQIEISWKTRLDTGRFELPNGQRHPSATSEKFTVLSSSATKDPDVFKTWCLVFEYLATQARD